MTARRRILMVTTNLSAAGGSAAGAAGNAWRLIIEELGEHVEGLVLTPKGPGLADRERIGGLEVRRIAPARPEESLEDALRGPGALRVGAVAGALWLATRRALRTGDYDLVHGLWAFPAGTACAWPRPRIPMLLSCPGSDLHAWTAHRWAGPAIRSVLRRADAVGATASDAVGIALRSGARSAHIVPICFDPRLFRMSPEPPAAPVIAYTGRMTRAKGVFVLAEALRETAGRIPDLRFVACGTGPDAGAFEASVRAALGDRATFHGPVAPERVASILAGCRTAVLPSFGEGMSAAAVEALAVGRPLVTTDVGEHPSLIRRGGGRVVPVGDAHALAEALGAELGTVRDPAALRALVEPYTPQRVAGRVLELYDLLLTHRSTASSGVLAGSAAGGAS